MTPEPIWVREDVAQAIHRRQLAEHGGTGGVRDAGGLESALARPRNLWTYSAPKPDLAGLSAAYAWGIIRNHPFVDGNKRVSYVVSRTFLLLNGYDLGASKHDKYDIWLSAASSGITEEGLADWIRRKMVKAD